MITRIVTSKPNHVSSQEAYAAVLAVVSQDGDFDERHEISDAVALTIASWWQSPGRSGMPFTSLSTTGAVEMQPLLAAIRTARAEADATRDRHALDALATWAINHPSRKR